MTTKACKVLPGKPYPLGTSWDGDGVNFALFSEHAQKVELCLFDARGRREVVRIAMPEQTNHVWHCYLPQARPGLLYGYRVHGPYAPENGHRFNPNKLLLDPYAKSARGRLRWHDAHFGYKIGARREDLSFDWRDNAVLMPKSQVVDSRFDWGDDKPPAIAWSDSVIYELHVKGFTIRHPEIPETQRGTYAALACAPVLAHLRQLGVTAVELMPIHYFVDDRHLLERGLRNYWGYNSIGFFMPDPRYSATGDPVNEFKSMVKALHAASIEVILDVVYNHTGEGNHLGPTLCFRGIDNAAYYRLMPDDPRYYRDYTGCGNTLDTTHPHVLQLIMDSLRYWVQDMHVDGFRFDLAATLAREGHEFDRHGAFLDIIHQDPVLSRVKLIAEPWDVGEGGYQVGNFPAGWTEWNAKYRDAVRAYWKGEGGLIGDLAYRLTGSSDLYAHNGRRPYASINFITSHDGFTLQDLVSHEKKHNEANGEKNQDGESNNLSWNCGKEGPSDDPIVVALRARQKRNLLTTLFLSQGIPMLTAGDEIGRSQKGNNNAYNQDNEISWLDWDLNPEERAFFSFACRVIGMRKQHPIFRRRSFFKPHGTGNGDKNILWFNPEGLEMSETEWNQGFAHCLGMYLAGDAIGEVDEHGAPLRDSNFLLLINAYHEAVPFQIPGFHGHRRWQVAIDTDDPDMQSIEKHYARGSIFSLHGRSLVLLQQSAPKAGLNSPAPSASAITIPSRATT